MSRDSSGESTHKTRSKNLGTYVTRLAWALCSLVFSRGEEFFTALPTGAEYAAYCGQCGGACTLVRHTDIRAIRDTDVS